MSEFHFDARKHKPFAFDGMPEDWRFYDVDERDLERGQYPPLPQLKGMLGEFYELAKAVNSTHAPGAAFAAALGLGSFLVCDCQTQCGARSNLFTVLIGQSGCGKNIIHKLTDKIVSPIIAPSPTHPPDPAISNIESFKQGLPQSAQGLDSLLLENPEIMIVLPEMGSWLAQMTGTAIIRDKSAAEMKARLLEAYDTDYLSPRKASKTENSRKGVVKPFVSFIGETQPDLFFKAMTPEALTSGFAQRLLPIHTEGEYVIGKLAQGPVAIPHNVMTFVQHRLVAIGQSRGIVPDLRAQFTDVATKVVPYGEGAFEFLERFAKKHHTRKGGIFNRAGLNAKRVALIMAVHEHPGNVITKEHAIAAVQVVEHSMAILDVHDEMVDNDLGIALVEVFEEYEAMSVKARKKAWSANGRPTKLTLYAHTSPVAPLFWVLRRLSRRSTLWGRGGYPGAVRAKNDIIASSEDAGFTVDIAANLFSYETTNQTSVMVRAFGS
jgi:hypothetical protein